MLKQVAVFTSTVTVVVPAIITSSPDVGTDPPHVAGSLHKPLATDVIVANGFGTAEVSLTAIVGEDSVFFV
jgi:hypothetical protein